MADFAVGAVVLVNSPFSDLSGQKLRPALILARAEFNDLILCQITSKPYSSQKAVAISGTDFAKGALPIKSYVRPDKIFTTDSSLVVRQVGQLEPAKVKVILREVRAQFAD